jgi:hypothetical protein
MTKPKFKPGDKVKVTLELDVNLIWDIKSKEPSYELSTFKIGCLGSIVLSCKEIDKIAKLVKKPAKKRGK